MNRLLDLPIEFFVSFGILIGLCMYAWTRRRQAWGIPTIVVCATVMVWYHGDALYNDYQSFQTRFSPVALSAAWWQVSLFGLGLVGLVPLVHRHVNRRLLGRESVVVNLIDGRNSLAKVSELLTPVFLALAMIWLVVNAIAMLRTDFDWRGLFAPWLGHKAEPWSRGRLGGGLDFLLSMVGYVNIFCLAGFGVVVALAASFRIRVVALLFVALSWPSVLFDRTRNTMLAIILPGLLCLVFLRLRRHRVLQIGVLVAAFLAVQWWMAFVISVRSSQSVAAAFAQETATSKSNARHEGLNMYEELCWINTFLENRTYYPNWGRRYFAEAVNIIPRGLWKNKPAIGLDYAVARGQGQKNGSEATVNATVSTGMIGQGVVNFGPWFGPPCAALLMSCWVAMLARLDLSGDRVGRLPLYVLGLVLTFNLGRDITLLVAFPVLFGYLIVRLLDLRMSSADSTQRQAWKIRSRNVSAR